MPKEVQFHHSWEEKYPRTLLAILSLISWRYITTIMGSQLDREQEANKLPTRQKHPDYITDEKGHRRAVILPIEEYEDLLEDLADLADLANEEKSHR